MITYEEAIRIVDEHAKPFGTESVAVGRAEGRFLAEDVAAAYDSPPFDNSAVDGFGRRLEDLSASPLSLAGEMKAGDRKCPPILQGHAVRIFTGAPIPPGIAAVSMQEDCDLQDRQVTFRESSRAGDHIRLAGDDFKRGDAVLRRGDSMIPPRMGIAVGAGAQTLSVCRRPHVSILTTGSELLDVNHDLTPGKIYDSNSYSLLAAVKALGTDCKLARSRDNRKALYRHVEQALDMDVVITCGGVSVGEYDLLKDVFAELGITQRFWGVAIKPGKPIYFGTLGEKLIFGLPGNPVSALVTFHLFVRPALLKAMGHPEPWPSSSGARFGGNARKQPGRMEFLRGVLGVDGTVRLAGEQGSHQLAALAEANCLIHFPLDASELRNGQEVKVTPLNWGLER